MVTWPHALPQQAIAWPKHSQLIERLLAFPPVYVWAHALQPQRPPHGVYAAQMTDGRWQCSPHTKVDEAASAASTMVVSALQNRAAGATAEEAERSLAAA